MMDLSCADLKALTKLFPLVESPAAEEGLLQCGGERLEKVLSWGSLRFAFACNDGFDLQKKPLGQLRNLQSC